MRTLHRPKHARPATKADETPEFVELWEQIWPAVKSPHDARALARDAFFRHVWWKDADPQDIVDAARFYSRNAKKLGECRLLLSNWLERGFYEDMAQEERGYQQRVAERLQRETSNVTPIRRQEPAIDNEARARHAQTVLARHGMQG